MRLAVFPVSVLTLLSAAADPTPVGSAAALSRAQQELRRARGGDPEAYARIVRAHQEAVGRRMGRFTRDAGQREELVQEVFVEAWFSLGKFRGDAPFEHWLARIGTRVGYRFWKSRERERQRAAVLEARARAAGETAQLREASVDAVALLERLPPRDRLVLTLLYVEGRTVAEAAGLAGWSRLMVKVQAHRARGKLKRLLEAEAKR